ncbi:MAG: CPBP family intramembrane metalloprotease [Candidatus Eisenbacteria bacterium]|uniref:CPBP family intramembrane metalloprotease n=1 Tax=Eiseniibacteriota bacterium TaxID=2212470 RepID=A0A933SCV4_UNCEI|nr:CPBP family intramembrane metalloprotease [Candidatus Eisenbacteria bacterium]
MYTAMDLALIVLVGVVYPIMDTLWFWPRMRPALLDPRPGARVPFYGQTIALQWIASGVIAALIAVRALPWREFGLVLPGGWRLAVSVALVMGLAALAVAQRRALSRLGAESRARVKARLGEAGLLLPRAGTEQVWFRALSVSAGICEEFLYRGWLTWALRAWLGPWGAMAASLASFTAAHAYQGREKLPRVAIVGGLLAMVALVTGSLLPAMVLHAMIDWMGGDVGEFLATEG